MFHRPTPRKTQYPESLALVENLTVVRYWSRLPPNPEIHSFTVSDVVLGVR